MHRLQVAAAILEHEISELRLILERRAGILLPTSNEALAPLLTGHIEARHMTSARDLLMHIQESDTELETLLELLLDSTSGFGRHVKAFEVFSHDVLPEIRRRKANRSPRSLRVWSAGCGCGEEAYAIAMAISEAINGDSGWSIHVVGSDIRRQALQRAERGLYPATAMTPVPLELLQCYFSRVGDHLLAKSRLRNMVAFTAMNLTEPSYLGRYDCIFCMDVLPHFSMAQRVALAQRLQLYLEPGGYLLLGDREKLPAAEIALESRTECGYTLYRKAMAAAAGL